MQIKKQVFCDSKEPERRKGFVIMAVVALLAFSPGLHATRILIFGDSWGEPMAPALRSVFVANGHTNITVEATEFWGLAARLASSEGLAFITKELNLRPSVDIVHLSSGVNDVHCLLIASNCRVNWDPSMKGTGAEANILATIMVNVETIVDHIFSIRPNIRVFWAGDDFVRPRSPTSKYGTPAEHNAVHIKQAALAQQLASRKAGLTYLHLQGLLQVTFGFDGHQYTVWDPPVPILPGDPSLPDPDLPGPNVAFYNPTHPTAKGNRVLAEGYYDGYYSSVFSEAGFQMNPGLNDAWYNPDTSGQGFFITVFPDLGFVTLAWFTYDIDLPPESASAKLGDPGHRWITAIGPIDGNQVVMDIDITSGGIFDDVTEVDHTDPPGSDGTLILTFDSCNSGTIEYDIPSINRHGTIPIQRVANDNIVLCEALSTN
jgi:hypothetical protein